MSFLRKNIILCLLIFVSHFVIAQQKALPKFALQIKKSIAQINNYNYIETPNIDIDKLCKRTANNVVKLLSDKKYETINFEKMGLQLAITQQNKTNVKIYNFSYDCGGTRRRITHPIVQWKDKQGNVYAHNLSATINCDFFEIHALKNKNKKLYLLIGAEAGDGACSQSVAYVIEVKDNKLITNNAVFVNRPYINLCNIDYTFWQSTQTLYGDYRYEDYGKDILNSIQQQGFYSASEKNNRALYVMLKEIYNESARIEIKFNGNKFIRISNSYKDIRP